MLDRAKDAYATYNAMVGGVNYQGLPCPEWHDLPDKIRGGWYGVALRSLHLGRADHITARGMCDAAIVQPDSYTLGHLPDPSAALATWQRYMGSSLTTPSE